MARRLVEMSSQKSKTHRLVAIRLDDPKLGPLILRFRNQGLRFEANANVLSLPKPEKSRRAVLISCLSIALVGFAFAISATPDAQPPNPIKKPQCEEQLAKGRSLPEAANAGAINLGGVKTLIAHCDGSAFRVSVSSPDGKILFVKRL